MLNQNVPLLQEFSWFCSHLCTSIHYTNKHININTTYIQSS
jgi:hypothetical protein